VARSKSWAHQNSNLIANWIWRDGAVGSKVIAEVRAIENIEELGAELEVQIVSDLRAIYGRGIDIKNARIIDRISPYIALGSKGLQRAAGRVNILDCGSGDRLVHDLIRIAVRMDGVVAEEFVCRTVQFVRSRSAGDIHRGPGSSELGAVSVSEDLNFWKSIHSD
jgi:hypothetical protein